MENSQPHTYVVDAMGMKWTVTSTLGGTLVEGPPGSVDDPKFRGLSEDALIDKVGKAVFDKE